MLNFGHLRVRGRFLKAKIFNFCKKKNYFCLNYFSQNRVDCSISRFFILSELVNRLFEKRSERRELQVRERVREDHEDVRVTWDAAAADSLGRFGGLFDLVGVKKTLNFYVKNPPLGF